MYEMPARRNVLAHFIGFIDYVFPEVMLGDLVSGELNDMFQRIPPCTYEKKLFEELSPAKNSYSIHHSKQNHVEHYQKKRFVEPNI